MKKLYSTTFELGNKSYEIFMSKPSNSDVENAEYVMGQKFNELLNDGFLSKAMMNKKFGDIGGIYSEKNNEDLGEALSELIECKRVIEFYGSAKDLTESQKKKLEVAEKTFAVLQKQIVENDMALKQMFAQSADTKAEEYMIKWFFLNFLFYCEKIEDKTESFKIFDKSNLAEKKEQLSDFLEDIDEEDSEDLVFKKTANQKALPIFTKVISLWYNGLGSNQEEIQKNLHEFFPEDFPKPVAKKKVTRKRVTKKKVS